MEDEIQGDIGGSFKQKHGAINNSNEQLFEPIDEVISSYSYNLRRIPKSDDDVRILAITWNMARIAQNIEFRPHWLVERVVISNT